jgi:hypothetical protein
LRGPAVRAYAPAVMDPRRRPKPPGGVRFAAWMIGIGAFFLCLFGLLLLLIHLDAGVLAQAQISRGLVQLVGFMLLAVGLLEFLLIYALWDGSNVARIITTVLVSLSLVGALGQALSGSASAAPGVIQLVISLAILVGLWGDPGATEFFRRPTMTSPLPPNTPAIPPRPV